MNGKKIAFLIIGMVAGLFLAVGVQAPEGLETNSMRILGIMLMAICWWAGEVFPEAITALIMSTLFVVFGGIGISTSFAAFSGTTFWLLVAAFGLGAAIKNCGLLERVAMLLLKLFPGTYKGQVLGLLSVTTVTAPFVPSKAAKCTILSPLTRSIGEAMGYENEGKETTGLFLAYFSAICFSATLFISASVTSYALYGLYSPEIQAEFAMVKWALYALFPVGLLFLGNYLYISYRYKPAGGQKLDMSFLQDKIAQLGVWSQGEKIMGVIMLVTILLWVLKPFDISEWAVAVLALCASVISGVLPVNKWRTSVAWESLIFIACAVSLATVLPAVGITDWLVGAIGGYTAPFFANPYLMVVGLAVLTLLARFLILSEIGYLTVFLVFLMPLASSAGVNPWVVGFIMYSFVCTWMIPYQSSVYLTAVYSGGDGWVTFKDTTKYCYVYCLITIIALCATVPIWQMLGIWYI